MYVLQCTEPHRARDPETVIERFAGLDDARAFANTFALSYFMVRVVDQLDDGWSHDVYRIDCGEVMWDLYGSLS